MRIEIECINCGHRGSLEDGELPRYGLAQDSSLVLVTRRLVCTGCGSRATRAYRREADAPPLAPH